MTDITRNLLSCSLPELESLVLSLGEKKFRAKQIFGWLAKGAASYDEMSNVPAGLRRKLSENGYYIGQPEVGFPGELQKIVLKGAKPIEGRAGALMEPVDFDAIEKHLREEHSYKDINPRNKLSYALYPKVYDEYANHWEVYTDVSKLSSDVFFFGLAKGEETVLEIGEGKEITIKYIDMTEPNEEGLRSLTFEINGVMREIKVLDKHLEVKSDGKLKADKNNPFHLGSSIPGTVSKVLVKEGDEVKKNQPLLTVEAMKMETSVVAKEDGVIDKIYVKEGDKVNQGDLLVSFVQ